MISMCNNVDCVIIGQGLAGSVLALTLQKNNLSYVIIDDNNDYTSSKAAAGIMHPLSFKRLILSWDAHEFIPFSQSFYDSINDVLGSQVYSPVRMIRIFSSLEEQNNWFSKAADYPYNNILKDTKNILNEYKIMCPYGHGLVNYCGRLNVQLFLKLCKQYFKSSKTYLQSSIKPSEIKKQKNGGFQVLNYNSKNINWYNFRRKEYLGS